MRSKDWSVAGRGLVPALAFLLVAVGLARPDPAAAIPAFARATDLPCKACHTAWPKLNRFGRAFKENGYAIERGNPGGQLEIGERLSIPAHLPFAVLLNSRPYDRKKGESARLRALHELEILAGASVLRYGSVFAEVAFEDEDNFDAKLEHAWGGFHPYPFFNVIGGYAPVFAADPYNTMFDRRLTRAKTATQEQDFLTGTALKRNTQMISVYGRAPGFERLFGLFTYAADRNNDFEGAGDEDFTGRVALDVTDWLTIGGFGIAGQETGLDFHRAGGDLQLDYGPFNVEAVGFTAYDERTAQQKLNGIDNDNFVVSAQTYLVLDQDTLDDWGLQVPDWFFQFVPLLRTDYFEVPDQSQKRTDLVMNLTYYAFQNAKMAIEYAQQLHGVGETRRVTFFLEVAF